MDNIDSEKIKYQIHNLIDVWDEVELLSKQHLKDTVSLGIIPDLDLDLEALKEMCINCEVPIVIASDKGRVIGYCIYILHKEILKKGKCSAVSLAVYMDKKYRGNLTYSFIDKCDNMLFDNVGEISSITKTQSDERICKIAKRCGYKKAGITLIKRRIK